MKKSLPDPSNGEKLLFLKYKYSYTCSIFLIFFGLCTAFFSCTQETTKTAENKNQQLDTIQGETIFDGKKDSLIQNGEYVKYYKNGVVEMKGLMKDGKREGVWESRYENGSLWSQTMFADGKKNGKSTAWYDNEKVRYEGFYSNDAESGKWTFWDENGKVQNTHNY